MSRLWQEKTVSHPKFCLAKSSSHCRKQSHFFSVPEGAVLIVGCRHRCVSQAAPLSSTVSAAHNSLLSIQKLSCFPQNASPWHCKCNILKTKGILKYLNYWHVQVVTKRKDFLEHWNYDPFWQTLKHCISTKNGKASEASHILRSISLLIFTAGLLLKSQIWGRNWCLAFIERFSNKWDRIKQERINPSQPKKACLGAGFCASTG